jgi:poly-gamma-glutamate synthesis protein (capsule biosynthesis protein)
MEGEMSEAITILIAGDTVPTETNFSNFTSGDIETVLNDTLTLFEFVDLSILNLECPLTDGKAQIDKIGPHLSAPSKSVIGLKKIGVDVVSMANNHILDYGLNGLNDTLSVLDETDIDHFGADLDLEAAREIKYMRVKNKIVSFIGITEHEYSTAIYSTTEMENNSNGGGYGANLFDVFDTLDDITLAKQKSDITIVLYHGGNEQYQYPSPRLQKICRRMAAVGADYVICNHSHCIGSYEKFGDSHIIYGQGNFIFNRIQEHPQWREGLLLELIIGEEKEIKFFPIVKSGNGVRLANNDERNEILGAFFERSQHLNNVEFLKKKYHEFALSKKYGYFSNLLGIPKILRGVDRYLIKSLLSKVLVRFMDRRSLAFLRHYIDCESHRDILLDLLPVKRK